MDSEISEFHEMLDRQRGCNLPDLQIFSDCQESHLYDQCDRIAEFVLP